MSLTFRLAKKKYSQDQLRKIMTDHKDKLKKIESPLAKYNDAGQLSCILCNSIVRSENVWNVHINTKQHKASIEQAKMLKAKMENMANAPKLSASGGFKRPSSPGPRNSQNKKIKGILKNPQSYVNSSSIPDDFFDLGSSNNSTESSPSTSSAQESEKIILNNIEQLNIEGKNEPIEVQEADDPLPEGFFDDPIMDAKARNIQYKDPIEEEWEKFKREMKEETSVSAAIIAGEQEEATAERQIDEIDEQIRNWSRVLDLDRKKEEAAKQKALESKSSMDCDEASSDEGDDFDEFLDWRAKKSFR